MKKSIFFSIKTAVIFLVFFIFMYLVINGSPYGLAKLREITGGNSILDMEFRGYTVDRAYEILGNLGTEGRNFHMKYILPLDFIFPLSYGLFYFVTLTIIAKAIWQGIGKPWLFGTIGIAATLFDILENIMIIRLLSHYPTHLERVAELANLFTLLKGIFLTSSTLLIAVGLTIIIIRRFMLKRKSKS